MLGNLEKVTTINYHNGTSSYNCRYKDYNISLGDSRIKLSGSIAKQYYGNNFQTITRPQLIKTIEERIIINMPLFKLKFNRSLLIKDRIKNVRDIANVDG